MTEVLESILRRTSGINKSRCLVSPSLPILHHPSLSINLTSLHISSSSNPFNIHPCYIHSAIALTHPHLNHSPEFPTVLLKNTYLSYGIRIVISPQAPPLPIRSKSGRPLSIAYLCFFGFEDYSLVLLLYGALGSIMALPVIVSFDPSVTQYLIPQTHLLTSPSSFVLFISSHPWSVLGLICRY